MEKIFDLVFGLPLHPLIDHVVVIFLPVFSMALIASFIFDNFAKKYGLLVQAGLGISFVSAFIAKQSGEALSLRVGTPIQHAELGENLVLISFGLFVSSVVWFYLKRQKNGGLEKALGLISVLLAVAAIVFTVLTGHSGAKAVWDSKINSQPIVQESAPSQSKAEVTGAITLNATEVAKHNSQNDCWTIIGNDVYDLTSYVNSHPGGIPNITRLCGIEGTDAFKSQHADQGKPNSQLKSLVLGTLGQVLNSTTQQTTTSNNSNSKPSVSVTKSATNLTAEEVALHYTQNDCWSVVNNQVYDLTSYVYSHPGGVGNIVNICGKDGSGLFQNQHGGQAKPNNVLSGFLLGTLTNSSTKLVSPTAPVGGEEGERENEGDDD